MHQSALFLTLATVALGASTKVNTNADIHTNTDSTTATVNLMNPPALAARNVEINVLHHVDTDSSIVRHPITVELGRRSDVNADLLKEDKPIDIKVMKRLNLDVGSTQKGHKLVDVDLNRRSDVTADLVKEDKPINVNVSKRLNLNVDTTPQEHKLINVDLNCRHLDVNADLLKEDKPVDVNVAKRLNLNVDATPQQEHRLINVHLNRRHLDVNTDLLNKDKPVGVNVAKRLTLNLDTTTHETTQKLINVDLNRRLDANINTNTNTQTTSTVYLARSRMPTALEVSRRNLDINTLLAKEHKLITVDLGKRLDLNIGTTVHTNTHATGEHKLINVDLGKRDLQMSTGYVLDTTKVDANGQATVVASKRDLNVNVKSEYQHLSARHSKSLSSLFLLRSTPQFFLTSLI